MLRWIFIIFILPFILPSLFVVSHGPLPLSKQSQQAVNADQLPEKPVTKVFFRLFQGGGRSRAPVQEAASFMSSHVRDTRGSQSPVLQPPRSVFRGLRSPVRRHF